MRAKIVPNKQVRELAQRAIEQERIEVCKVFVKIAVMVLWDQFGFGMKRGQRFVNSIFAYLSEYFKDYGEDFDYKLDQELKRAKININFGG